MNDIFVYAPDDSGEVLQRVKRTMLEFILDARFSDSEVAIDEFGLRLDEEEMQAAYEESDERTARLQRIDLIMKSFAAMAADVASMTTEQGLETYFEEFPLPRDDDDDDDSLSDVETGLIVYTAAIVFNAVRASLSASLTQLEKHGFITFNWESEEES